MTDSKSLSTNNLADLKDRDKSKLIETLKLDITKLAETHLNSFKTAINDSVKSCQANIDNKIKDIKLTLSKEAEGDTLYDYSKVPEIRYFSVCDDEVCYNFTDGNKLHKCSFQKDVDLKEYLKCFKSCCRKKKCVCTFPDECDLMYKRNFLNFIKNEKIVIHHYMKIDYVNEYVILITNYGRIIKFNKCFDADTSNILYASKYYHFDFWIPCDYIVILKTLNVYEINIVLQEMKQLLYNRLFVPSYITDIVKENQNLKDKYSTFEKEHKKFLEDKHKFEIESKFILGLQKERDEINALKEMLKTCSAKQLIYSDKEKLEADKKRIETSKRAMDEP